MKKTVGIYIHIPYCKKKCYYCDFLSSCNYKNLDEYMKALYKEVVLYKEKFGSHNIDTIYIGGGTPSSIESSYIEKVIDVIDENNKILPSNEITIEVNPESVTYEKLKSYYNSGINRLSMGCQSFDDEKLKSIGRNCPAISVISLGFSTAEVFRLTLSEIGRASCRERV